MTMSSYYQPLVIRRLIEAGGRQSTRELAVQLLVEDHFAVARAHRILMRWPYLTLRKHGVIGYDKSTREFVLLARFDNPEQREQVLARCTDAVQTWRQRELPKIASRFFRVIERAGGRCEACGIPGSIRPIDVDHIIPKSRTRRGKVTLPDGSRVPADDERNLQALCSRCNRGKRDTSTYDFRPSADRLRETIVLTLQKAQSQGYDWKSVLADAEAELT
jgi:5-methylcytosine-specific restriction endonuclease McrA